MSKTSYYQHKQIPKMNFVIPFEDTKHIDFNEEKIQEKYRNEKEDVEITIW